MVSKTKRKYYMLDKKEGICKTSYAASLRVKFADSEHPILVVSADLTHSLNNSFAQRSGVDIGEVDSKFYGEISSVNSGALLLTLVQEIIEEKLVIPSTFSFMSFADLEKYKDCNAQVDIIALAIDMKPAREIRTRQGLSMIQEIIVINQELKPMLLTFWDQFVVNEAAKIIEVIKRKPIIIVAHLKVVSYNDVIRQKSYLNSASSSTTPSEEDVIEIAKIENLLPEVN
ncbi:hypothetical protein Dsin_021191 [Dipteronia sinensis]|uniref:ArsA/GET3 Anion-transporting ATPase-like domain-containing protein n=1 Tax=Dipteronia sinensis TaxID=43782 RepID=A0AAE0E4D4_9ROSI|nr:hypothetical protein Dsin_021191 [Dipteronia sinensis]